MKGYNYPYLNSASYGAWEIFSPFGSCFACAIKKSFILFNFYLSGLCRLPVFIRYEALVCETSPWESHPRRVLRRLRREVSLTPVLVIATTESNSASTTWVLSLALNKGHGALVGSAWGFPQHKERTWWMYIQLSKSIAGFCPTIPYSNFWGRKTTHFLKLFQKNFLGSCKTSRKQKIPPWNSQREVPYILLYLHRQNGQLVKTQKTKKDPLP